LGRVNHRGSARRSERGRVPPEHLKGGGLTKKIGKSRLLPIYLNSQGKARALPQAKLREKGGEGENARLCGESYDDPEKGGNSSGPHLA